jgi:benzoylformate decarboxylase
MAPWPAFEEVSIAGLAKGLGCPATSVETHDDLITVLDGVVPTLAARAEPLVLEVAVVPETTFAP